MTASRAIGHIGMIGYGLVGRALSHRMLSGGADVAVHDTDGRRLELAGRDGLETADGVEALIQRMSLGVVSVPSAEQVLELLPALSGSDSPVTCLTTMSPVQEQEVRDRAAGLGLRLACTPISGTSQQIASGNAVLLSPAGTIAILGRWLPVLAEAVGTEARLTSAPSAAGVKLALNLVVEGNRAVLAEGFSLATVLGLDPTEFLALVQRTTASSRVAESKGIKLASRDFTAEAHLQQSLDDVEAMLELAANHQQHLPITASIAALLRASCREGLGELDSTALLLHLERLETAVA